MSCDISLFIQRYEQEAEHLFSALSAWILKSKTRFFSYWIPLPPHCIPVPWYCTHQIKEVGVMSDKIWSETERDYLCHGFQMFLLPRMNSMQNRITHISKGICARSPKRKKEKVAIVLDWRYLKGDFGSGETKQSNIQNLSGILG